MKTNKTKIFIALFIVLSVLMSIATLTVYASDTQTVVEEHYFTDKGDEVGTNGTPFFIMGEDNSYSKASDKGKVTYNGVAITNCLKMNSKGTVAFDAPSAGTLKLVFNQNAINKEFMINDTVYTVGSDATFTVNLAAGNYVVKQQKSTEIYLYYISFTYTTDDAPVHTCTWEDVEGTVVEPTCTTAGSKTQSCECGKTQVVELPALGHTPTSFVTTAPTANAAGGTSAICSVCEETINYGATKVMTPGTYVLEGSDLKNIKAGDYADGEVKVVNDVFAVHLSANYKTDSSDKKFSDGYNSSDRMNYGGKTEYLAKDPDTGEIKNVIKNAIEITTTGKTTVKIHWVCCGNGRQVGLYTFKADGDTYEFDNLCNSEGTTTKNSLYISELEVSAGTYYIGNVGTDGGNYHFRIEVTVECNHNYVEGVCSVCDAKDPNYVPHVNTLVVGDTNKIVVTGKTLNEYNLPIEWVAFVAEETANYAFVGDNGALAFIFDTNGNIVSATGAANLEAGTYLICVGNGLVGEFNVAVTKTPIEDVTPVGHPQLQLGDNTVTIDGTEVNLTGAAIAWLELVVEESGTYTVTSTDLSCYIYSEMNLASFEACLCGWTGVATLEPGTYYVCVGNDGVTGEFTVNVSKGDVEAPYKNTVALGDNHYVISDDLLAAEHEWITIEITEPGTYVIKGGAPMTIFFFTVPGTLSDTSPYQWNVDITYAFLTEFEVTLTEAGTYWMGFRYDYVGEQREFDFNISLKPAAPAHECESKCETCGKCTDAACAEDACKDKCAGHTNTTPDPTPNPDPNPEPQEKGWFENIWETIVNVFNQIVDFFKNLFSSFKK